MARTGSAEVRRRTATKVLAPDLPNEFDHFHACPECGQNVDRRDLADLLHHEQPGHKRRPSRVAFVEPMVPTLVSAPPDGDEWQHEIKYDGYRTQLLIDGDSVRAITRRGYDWTGRYPAITASAATLRCSSAIIDGEAIVQDAQGRSDFGAFKKAMADRPEDIILMAFDLLHLNGRDLRSLPLAERRERLRELIGPSDPGSSIQFSDHVVGNGAGFLEAADRMGLEGIVSKRRSSRYRSGASRSWFKTKCFGEGEFVVIGTSRGDRAPVALLARETEAGLEYAGAAMVTLADPERDRFWRWNERLKTPDPVLPMEPRKETSWLRPEIRVRAQFLRGEEMLRHATVKSVTAFPRGEEEPAAGPAIARRRSSRPTPSEPGFPAPPLIDRDAIRHYYEMIAPSMLRHVAGRVLNLVRCWHEECFYQRHSKHPPTLGDLSNSIRRLPLRQKNGKVEDYLYVEDEAGLLACLDVQAIEFHGWGSRVGDVERPDRLVIDLDPGETVSFEQVKAAAADVRRHLEALGLLSFPLLTGGKGIHVVVPLTPAAEWPEVRGFAQDFCTALAQLEPDRFTVRIGKTERNGRIFLDFLRNQRTSTAVLPLSVRAREGNPVAAPVTWQELGGIDRADFFTIADAPRLARRATSRTLRGWGEADQGLPG